MIEAKYNWIYNNIKYDEEKGFVYNILKSRGMNDLEINEFINGAKEDLYNTNIKDMDIVTKRIIEARDNKEKVMIYGDYDVDGVTSTSVLYLYLKKIGVDVSYYIPNRLTEGYGMNEEALKGIISDKYTLVITVDNGISAASEAEILNEVGIDLIITDHHEVPEVLPKALAIINPKRVDDDYPFKLHAGVAVANKVVIALKNILGDEDLDEYMDLVTLGTIADVVSLTGENREIVKLGLEKIKNTKNPGLKALLEICKLNDKSISSKDVGFMIGPRLNAAGRTGNADVAVELFVTDENSKEIAMKLQSFNEERQKIEKEILKQVEDKISELDLDNLKILILKGEEWHHGVIGIVAAKVADKYNKPTIILSEEDGKLVGSARSVGSINIYNIIANSKDKLVRFGGHPGAAGLTIDLVLYDDVKLEMEEYAKSVITEKDLLENLNIDLEINIDDITISKINELDKLKPFGEGNREPSFKIRGNIVVADIIGKNENHLKLKLKSENNNSIECVGFNKAYLYEDIVFDKELELVGKLNLNEFNDNIKVQFLIDDASNTEEYKIENGFYKSLYKNVVSEVNVNLDDVTIYNDEKNVDKNTRNIFFVNSKSQLSNVIEHKNKLGGDICFGTIVGNAKNNMILINSKENIVDLQKKCNIILDNMYKFSTDVEEISVSKEKVSKVYRHLMFLNKIGKKNIKLEEALSNINEINLYEAMISMTILNELEIIKCGSVEDKSIKFEINNNIKNPIENSDIYMRINSRI